jgi:hypothetical protein
MRIVPALLLLLAACASSAPDRPAPRAVEPGGPVIVDADGFPPEITGLLTTAEADSCGVCVREKRAEAFELAELWFAPGHFVEPGATPGWRLLPGGEAELYFGDTGETSPRLSFRFHTEDDHLVGISPEDYTDPQLAVRILERPAGTPGTETLEVIRFAYGDGESFLFDEATNRLQVQCRVIEGDAGSSTSRFGGTQRESRRR